MTQTSDIILAAFRESIQDPLQHPSPTEYAQAMVRLKSIVTSVYGAEIGETLSDWAVGAEGEADADPNWTQETWQYPTASSRIVVQLAESETVYLPEQPDDGSRVAAIDPNGLLSGALTLTLDGNGRGIGATVAAATDTYVMDAANETLELLYRADLGIWLVVSTLTDTGDFPFPEVYDDFFILMLAMRINPRYGRTLNEQQVLFLERAQGQMRAQYRQRRTVAVDAALRARTGSYGSFATSGAVPRGPRGWMR